MYQCLKKIKLLFETDIFWSAMLHLQDYTFNAHLHNLKSNSLFHWGLELSLQVSHSAEKQVCCNCREGLCCGFTTVLGRQVWLSELPALRAAQQLWHAPLQSQESKVPPAPCRRHAGTGITWTTFDTTTSMNNNSLVQSKSNSWGRNGQTGVFREILSWSTAPQKNL